MNLVSLPQPGTRLPVLKLREKGDWQGIVPRLVGLVVSLGVKLGIRAASRFLEEYSTVFPGGSTIYHPPGKPPSLSLQFHERVHAWQAEHYGVVRYVLMWLVYRAHIEAVAYAAQVAAQWRTVTSAAESLHDPIYATGLTLGEAYVLIMEYRAAWQEAGWTATSIRKEAARG